MCGRARKELWEKALQNTSHFGEHKPTEPKVVQQTEVKMCCGKFIKKIQTSFQELFTELLQSEGPFANRTHEEIPSQCSTGNLPAASICGSNIHLSSVCPGVRLIYLIPVTCSFQCNVGNITITVRFCTLSTQFGRWAVNQQGSASLKELRGCVVMAWTMETRHSFWVM